MMGWVFIGGCEGPALPLAIPALRGYVRKLELPYAGNAA